MKNKLVFFLILIFAFSSIPNVSAADQSCTLQPTTSSEMINEKFFLIESCNLQKNDLTNSLIHISFENLSDNDFIVALIDANGRIVSSGPILNWYGVEDSSKANIVIDPNDLLTRKTAKKFLLDDVQTINIYSDSNSYSIHMHISEIEPHETFSPFQNLPVQDPFPGFLSLILVSFPTGYVLLYYSRFQKEQNFIVKIPWILGFGFIVYSLYSFTISRFWISTETIFVYIIFEYIILVIFVYKNNKLKLFLRVKSKKLILFFIVIFLVTGYVSVSYSQTLGWPTGYDSRIHIPMISLGVETHSIGVEKEILPISEIPNNLDYPTGSHASAAGISLLTGLLPAVSMVSIFSFVLFLIPCMLTSIVYKYTSSIFFSSLMFMLTFWRPYGTGIWEGDILRAWIKGNFAGEVGVLILFVTLVLLIEFFERDEKKLKIFILFVVANISLFVVYYGFTMLPIIIGIIGITVHYVRNKRKFIIIMSSLSGIFLSLPFYNQFIFGLVFPNAKLQLPYVFGKLLRIDVIFNGADISPILPYTISAVISMICACFLIRNKTFRYISLAFLGTALLHFLSFDYNLALNYFFYYKTQSDLQLVILLTIAINLITVNYIFEKTIHKYKLLKIFKGNRLISFKIITIILLAILLIPSILAWNSIMDPAYKNLHREVPGGNEKNLQFWLYENTNKTDLILNDYSVAAQWYIGFRAQPLTNDLYQWHYIVEDYDNSTKTFNPTHNGTKLTLKANKILDNAWDYDYIQKTLKELDIDYLYISESSVVRPVAFNYPQSNYWKNYQGNARIAMYEDHPNLKLILRNGDSAIFKAVNLHE